VTEELGEPNASGLVETCYGCVHQRYRGSHSVRGVKDMVGGTAIPTKESDAGVQAAAENPA
jgi:hypothetical protein